MFSIIYAHPYPGSFNHAILQTIMDQLQKSGKKFALMDLYADGFDAAVRQPDLALYNQGGTNDQLAIKYMDILKKSQQVIFIYPVWWGVEPAIVQGFYDKVFLKDFAWKYSPEGRLLPLLSIDKTFIFSTSDAPGHVFRAYFEDYLPVHVFDQVGLRNLVWRNLDGITRSTETQRKNFLELAAKTIA